MCVCQKNGGEMLAIRDHNNARHNNKLCRAILNKRRGILTSSGILHDKVHLHTDASTRALLEHFNWKLSDHLPYIPDLAPSDYHLFTRTYLKNWLGSQCFNSNEELLEGVKTKFSSQAAYVFDRGIQRLIPQ
jgi:hypothetical protein